VTREVRREPTEAEMTRWEKGTSAGLGGGGRDGRRGGRSWRGVEGEAHDECRARGGRKGGREGGRGGWEIRKRNEKGDTRREKGFYCQLS